MPPERRKVKIKAWIDDIVNKDVKDLNVMALYDSDGVVIPIEMLSMLGLSLGSGNEILVGGSATHGPKLGCIEDNSASIYGDTTSLRRGMNINSDAPRAATIDYSAIATVQIFNYLNRVADTAFPTLAADPQENIVLTTAVAGYYDVIELTGLWCDSAITPAFEFEDEDDTALTNAPASFNVGVFAAGEYKSINPPLIMYASADNKDCEVDITGGGAGEVVGLMYNTYKMT